MKLKFLEAGQVVSTHGVRGEIKILPWVDSPEFLLDYRRLRIGGTEYKVENCRVQRTCNLLKLSGVDTMDEANALRGKTVELYREDVPEDIIFAAELIQMDVFADGVCLGQITEVLDYPGNKVYVVSGEKEYMIPAVKEFILATDLASNRMDVRLIEGMETNES